MRAPSNPQARATILLAVAAAIACFVAAMATPRNVRLHGPRETPRPELPDMRIDINRAGGAELALLPGLGAVTAQKIIAERDRNGHFTSIDDLSRVIAPNSAVMDQIRPYIVAD